MYLADNHDIYEPQTFYECFLWNVLIAAATVRALIFAGLNFRGFRGLEAIRESLNQRKV